MDQNKKVGRPKKQAKNKKDAHIFINLTQEQKARLIKLSEDRDISLSRLCIQALIDAKYLK